MLDASPSFAKIPTTDRLVITIHNFGIPYPPPPSPLPALPREMKLTSHRYRATLWHAKEPPPPCNLNIMTCLSPSDHMANMGTLSASSLCSLGIELHLLTSCYYNVPAPLQGRRDCPRTLVTTPITPAYHLSQTEWTDLNYISHAPPPPPDNLRVLQSVQSIKRFNGGQSCTFWTRSVVESTQRHIVRSTEWKPLSSSPVFLQCSSLFYSRMDNKPRKLFAQVFRCWSLSVRPLLGLSLPFYSPAWLNRTEYRQMKKLICPYRDLIHVHYLWIKLYPAVIERDAVLCALWLPLPA